MAPFQVLELSIREDDLVFFGNGEQAVFGDVLHDGAHPITFKTIRMYGGNHRQRSAAFCFTTQRRRFLTFSSAVSGGISLEAVGLHSWPTMARSCGEKLFKENRSSSPERAPDLSRSRRDPSTRKT